MSDKKPRPADNLSGLLEEIVSVAKEIEERSESLETQRINLNFALLEEGERADKLETENTALREALKWALDAYNLAIEGIPKERLAQAEALYARAVVRSALVMHAETRH